MPPQGSVFCLEGEGQLDSAIGHNLHTLGDLTGSDTREQMQAVNSN